MTQLSNDIVLGEPIADLEAVEANPFAIMNIENQTVDLQLLAVHNNPKSITVIKEPIIEVQEYLLSINPHYIRFFIKKASPEIRAMALEADPATIRYFKKPTKEELKIIIRKGEKYYLTLPTKHRTTQLDFYNLLWNVKLFL